MTSRLLDSISSDITFPDRDPGGIRPDVSFGADRYEFIYREFIETSHVLIWQIDIQGRFTFLSKAWEALLGYSRQEMIGRKFTEFQPRDHAARVEQELARHNDRNRPEGFETAYLGKAGNVVWLVFDGIAIRDERGTFIGARGTSFDVTERRRAENRLRESEERYRSVAELTSEWIWEIDAVGRHTSSNEVILNILGYSHDEFIGKVASIFMHPDDKAEVEREFPKCRAEKRGWRGWVIRWRHQDGSYKYLESNAEPILSESGELLGFRGSDRDVTERELLMENMRRIGRLDSLGAIAGGIAHDFNNLLCGLLGHLDLARSHANADPAILNHLDKALGVFNRARDLTQQLLSFSKDVVPKRKAGHISATIVDNATFALSGSNVRCEYNIESNLRLCEFDENQIGQVISNIVINAQQAMPLGGRITISAKNVSLGRGEIPTLSAGNYVQISIADAGIGIPGEILSRIFEPFFTTKQKGNGLGLSICQSIILKHDGFIAAESHPGKGTIFHLYLPASGKEIPEIGSFSLPVHKGNGKIVIMDDEEVIRDVMSQMLVSMGYDIVKTSDGEETLRYLTSAWERGEPVKAAFLDLTIPGGMGGKSAVMELRKILPDLPVFVSSGYAEDPAIAKPADFGFTGSILKPYLITDLADLLNRHLKVPET